MSDAWTHPSPVPLIARVSLAVALLVIASCRKQSADTEFVVFDQGRSCTIAVSERATPAELQAAEMLRRALLKASGQSGGAFPIIRVDDEEMAGGEARDKPVRRPGSTLYLRGTNHLPAGAARLSEQVRWKAAAGRLELTSYPADAIEAAAAWFLCETVGARWFMPGEIGEHVPARTELRLAFGERVHTPSFISRNLALGDSAPESAAWWRHNRMRASFRHGHAMSALFKPDDFRKHPEWAPLVNGVRLAPMPADGNWQPNLAAPGVAEHVAEALRKRPEFSSAIGLNDSIRFDQSPATRAAVGEAGWFRQRPDYSGMYFRFVNDVARLLPNRFLAAYAYDWTENTPGFAVQRNVVPYLTADRSEWFDESAAQEDQALIRRWVSSGAEVVGIYDYYYGAPFLVPRPTLYAVTRSIPFARGAGVRAFYAEVYPNWGLDGPKAWLAAELLWDAAAKPEELLDVYYRDYWREVAGPMREFFSLCDEQWLQQPKPAYWIKYYKDEHQHLLFPADVREKLRGRLAQARAGAKTELTRQRVEFTAGAFAVSDAFCAWEEAKEELSRAALAAAVDEAKIRTAWKEVDARERELKRIHPEVTKATPLAIKAAILGEYERNDPRLRAAWRLRSTALKSAISNRTPTGEERLKDTTLLETRINPPTTSFDLEWVQGGPWRGHGEPYETRRVSLDAGGSRSELVMRGCKQETFSQLVGADAGQYYLARVKFRGKVSPGNMTFLILNFQDAEGRALGLGAVDRLPVGNYPDGVELVVWAQAPRNAKSVGLGVRALSQVNDDFAAFSGFSLQTLAP